MTAQGTSAPVDVPQWGPARWITWFSIALAFEGCVLWILLATGNTGSAEAGRLGWMWNDSKSYLDPIESLLRGEGYQPDFRMPGYGLVYLFLRLFTDPPFTFDVMVVLQLIVAAISTCVLARMARALTGSHLVFLLTFFIYAISISVHYYDVAIMTESLCTSMVIFFMDRLLAHHRTGRGPALIWAGLWIAWATFMRPVLGALLVFAAISLLVAWGRQRIVWRHLLLLGLPWLIADGLWIARNGSVNRTFTPLTRTMWIGYSAPNLKLTVYEFVRTIGGDFTWWGDPKADMRFFNAGDDQVPGHTNADQVTLPGYIYTADFTVDSLRAISRNILALKDPAFPEALRHEQEMVIKDKLEHYERSFIETHPFHYQVTARLRMLKIYLEQPGIPIGFPLPFGQLPLHLKALKLFYFLLHYALLAGSLLGAIWLWRSKEQRAFALALIITVLFAITVFPLGMRYTEHRFMVPFIPCMLLVAVWGIHMRWRGASRPLGARA